MFKITSFIKNINQNAKNNDTLKILNFIATSDNNDSYLKTEQLSIAKKLRMLYILLILFVVVLSFLPLFFPPNQQIEWTQTSFNLWINIFIFVVLIIDYFLRWISYPVRSSKYSIVPLLFFPITGVGILMFISLLPTLFAVFSPFIPSNNPFVKLINVFSAVKIIRLILLLKVIPTFSIFSSIFIKNKTLLFNVFAFVFLMALIFALVIYSVEGGTIWVEPINNMPPEGAIGGPNEEGLYEVPVNPGITSYWDSLYFTFITITTIGYGDIIPKTDIGRIVVIIDAVLGIVVFSIPSSIITGSFIVEVQEIYKKNKKSQKEHEIEKLSFIERIYIKTKEKTETLLKTNNKSNETTNKEINKIIKISGDLINNKNNELIDQILSYLNKNNILSYSINENVLNIVLENDQNINNDFITLIFLLNLKLEIVDKN